MRYPLYLYPAVSGGKHIWNADCEVLSIHASGNTPFTALLDLEEKEKALLRDMAGKGIPLPDIPTKSLPDGGAAPSSQKKKAFTIYTDGACSGNPGPGGWAFIILDEDGVEYARDAGYEANTTNNRMEMMAALMGIRALPSSSQAVLVSDSNYVISTMNGKFSKKKNLDLWDLLDAAAKEHELTYSWVRGHNGNPYNEQCNDMAVNQYKEACI